MNGQRCVAAKFRSIGVARRVVVVDRRPSRCIRPARNSVTQENVCDNAAMESFFSSLKTERTTRRMYRTRDDAKADVFDYIERFYNPKRRHSTIGYLSPMEFERQARLA